MNSPISQSDLVQRLSQAALQLQSGHVEDAVRTSGEVLAECDNNLRMAKQSGDDLGEAAETLIEAAHIHVRALSQARAFADAFSCCTAALLTLEVYGVTSSTDSVRKMQLYSLAIRAAIECFERLGAPASDADEAHRGFILSYIASLLYYNYGQAVKDNPEESSLGEVYSFLKSISSSGAIQSPMIQLGEKEVNPASPGPILIDIMGRGAALGIYN